MTLTGNFFTIRTLFYFLSLFSFGSNLEQFPSSVISLKVTQLLVSKQMQAVMGYAKYLLKLK